MRAGVCLAWSLALVALAAACGGGDGRSAEASRNAGEPAGACPSSAGAAQATEEPCVPFEPDGAAAANEAYRQRGQLSSEHAEQADRKRARIEGVLRSAAAGAVLDGADVVRILATAGYHESAAYGRSDVGGGVAFGVASGSGCVFGRIRAGEVEAEIGGAIADGGCLPAQGH